MQPTSQALHERVQQLLNHLDDVPAAQDALPFVVSYLVGQLREVTRSSPIKNS